MPELDYMVLADYVRMDAGGVHIMGAGIDTITAPLVPTAHTVHAALHITFGRITSASRLREDLRLWVCNRRPHTEGPAQPRAGRDHYRGVAGRVGEVGWGMRLDYDLDADALYIKVTDNPVARTVDVDTETLVDEDADGRLVGIEVISFRRLWPLTEILAQYEMTDADVAQLRALFRPGPDQRYEIPQMTERDTPAFAA